MSIQVQMEQMSDYLVARFTGKTKEAVRQFESIAELCKRSNKNKLLLDFTDTHSQFSLTHRYLLADACEGFVHYKIQVAVVCKPEQLDSKKFGEMAARNRGVNVRIFTNVEDAEEWLLK